MTGRRPVRKLPAGNVSTRDRLPDVRWVERDADDLALQ
jgi:hypothetical protein